MKGDFTRNTFDPKKRYTGVRLQQGRVLLDADWNEQVDIQHYLDRATYRDVIGISGAPAGASGFAIQEQEGQLIIGKGRFYIDGILVENNAERSFTEQPDFPDAPLPDSPGIYIFYLDVWEHHVTHLEDPDVAEIALGGPDTTTRTQVVWQVKWYKWNPTDANLLPTCDEALEAIRDTHHTEATLAARTQPEPPLENLCELPEEAGYRGLENQLYRIEIHDSGRAGEATFKWSRENGTIVARWLKQDGRRLTVAPVGRDKVSRFNPGDWVELTDDTRVLKGEPGVFVRIDSIEDDVLVIDRDSIDLKNFGPNPKVRRWESEPQTVTTNRWISLENGIQIQFQGDRFRNGDYWTLPARTAISDILWPIDEEGNPRFEPPEGISHHYAILAIARYEGSGEFLHPAEWRDCRKIFPPLTELPRGDKRCCTVTVGDGVHSHGDVNRLHEAIARIQDRQEAIVCLLPGVHQLDETMSWPERLNSLHIQGCGPACRIEFHGENEPAFQFAKLSRLHLENLTVTGKAEPALITLNACRNVTIEQCWLLNGFPPPHIATHVTAASSGLIPHQEAVRLTQSAEVTVRRCVLLGQPALSMQASQADIENNRCLGGLWLWDGSSDLRIRHNRITKYWTGILLGSLPDEAEPATNATGVVNIHIHHNRIENLPGNGIQTNWQIDPESGTNRWSDLGEIENLIIENNQIRHCAQDTENEPVAGGIVLHHVRQLRIDTNQIHNNGHEKQPACGLFLTHCQNTIVTNNRIAANGSRDFAQDNRIHPIQGGIVATLLWATDMESTVCIEHNDITTPMGPALWLFGVFGPVMLNGNRLVSENVLKSNNPYFNSGVFVLGTGLPQPNARFDTTAFSHVAIGLPHLPCEVQWHHNQIDIHASRSFIAATVMAALYGDLSAANNQSRVDAPSLLTNWLALGETVRVSDNRLVELAAWFSGHIHGTRFNLVKDNQADHCLAATGPTGTVLQRDNQIANDPQCAELLKILGVAHHE